MEKVNRLTMRLLLKIKANMSLMKDRPLGQRQTIATSICVLEAAKKYIMEK